MREMGIFCRVRMKKYNSFRGQVGIVGKVENGIIYTVEGNSGDSCQENSYPIGYNCILGYGRQPIEKLPLIP